MLFFDALLTALGILLPLIVVAAVMLLLVTLGPRMVAGWRQRAYDETSAAEAVRLTVVPPAGLAQLRRPWDDSPPVHPGRSGRLELPAVAR